MKKIILIATLLSMPVLAGDKLNIEQYKKFLNILSISHDGPSLTWHDSPVDKISQLAVYNKNILFMINKDGDAVVITSDLSDNKSLSAWKSLCKELKVPNVDIDEDYTKTVTSVIQNALAEPGAEYSKAYEDWSYFATFFTHNNRLVCGVITNEEIDTQ